jgi:CBS domain-containing protein
MARTVDEIMNHELFSLKPGERVEDALGFLLALGITTAPVLDDKRRPVGVVSLRDLIGAGHRFAVAERMSRPVVTVKPESSIEEAARLLGDTDLHHLVVADEDGAAVGIVSSIDVVRALVGLPARHPGAFPHYDFETGLVWTDDIELKYETIEAAPDGPGVLVLIHGGAGEREHVVWAEAASSLRGRLLDLLSLPQVHVASLARWLERGRIRFRAAAVADAEERQRIAARILERARRELASIRAS